MIKTYNFTIRDIYETLQTGIAEGYCVGFVLLCMLLGISLPGKAKEVSNFSPQPIRYIRGMVIAIQNAKYVLYVMRYIYIYIYIHIYTYIYTYIYIYIYIHIYVYTHKNIYT